MYHIRPVFLITDDDIVHTDNMYKMGISDQPVPVANATDLTDQFACFFPNKSGARSKLGQALEAMGHQQGDKPGRFEQRAEKCTFRAVPHSEVSNEMNLDKYIIRKMAPSSSLGKYLHSQQASGNRTDQDMKFLHRLKEMEQVLDSFLVPMGLVKSSEHVSSSLLTNTKGLKPTVQPTKHIDKPPTESMSSFMANKVPSCASPSMSHTGDDAKVVSRLKELDEVLDGLLIPMGLVKSKEHVPFSQPTDSETLEPTPQPTRHVEEPSNTPTPPSVTTLVPPCDPPSMGHTDDDAKMVHRLRELDEVLDGLLVPMGLVKSSEYIPLSQLTDTAVIEPPAQIAQQIGKPITESVPSFMGNLVPPYTLPSMSHIYDDAKSFHPLGPMSLVNSSEHVPSAQITDGKVLELSTQPTKYVEESATTSTSAPVTKLVSFLSPPAVDLAIHCDPKTPPFAVLLYSKMLKLEGHNVSLQFYKHSTLASIPDRLPQLEKFFADQPRSSASELIISIIWRPCALGCMAISNPFTDLPLYGESAILMFLSSLSPDFAQIFQDLSSIDSAVLAKNSGMLVDCIEKFGKTGFEPFSIEELLLFISCEVAGLSPLVQGASKSWFSRCMSNGCFAMMKNMIDHYH